MSKAQPYEESRLYKLRHSASHVMAQAVLEMLMASVGLWAANVLGAAIGVLLGFVARRRPYLAVGLAPCLSSH